MRKVLTCGLGLAVLGLTAARGDESAKGGDQHFVHKASAAGLAEVNLGALAAKRASDPEVRKFAERMVRDHTKANKELIALANKKGLKVAEGMDAKHRKCEEKLLSLRGAAFDREYMDGQLKDHKEAVSLFEKESKSGKDEDLKAWAGKTLPHLREHLKMAQEAHKNLKGTSRTSK
jgi:putative membrane protein